MDICVWKRKSCAVGQGREKRMKIKTLFQFGPFTSISTQPPVFLSLHILVIWVDSLGGWNIKFPLITISITGNKKKQQQWIHRKHQETNKKVYNGEDKGGSKVYG